MLIREFQASDTDEVIQLWHDCGLTRPWNHPKRDIERKLAVDPALFLVGVLSDKLVAAVMGGYDGHRGWINYMAISPVLQGEGLGRQLMLSMEDRLLQRGCAKINLQIRSDNHSVIDFYASLGFTQDKVVSMGKRLIPD